MSGRGQRGGLGFGAAVGLGIAAAILITVIAALHALGHQLVAMVSLVLVFATIALCALLVGVVLGVVGLLAQRGQLARLEVAERRLAVERQAREVYAVRAEVLADDDAEALPQATRAAILGKQPVSATGRHLEAVPERKGYRRTFLGYVPERGADADRADQ